MKREEEDIMRRRSDVVSVKKKLLVANSTILLFICYFSPVSGGCTCDKSEQSADHGDAALKYKLAGIGTILAAGGLGVSLPLLGRKIPALRPENDIFFMIKAFAAGVILATGFIHILPDAFDNLTSPCLKENPWGRFPFTGFVAMVSAIGTLMIDTLATGYYKRQHFEKRVNNSADEEQAGEHAGHIHVHTHATHGHAHGSTGGDDIDSSSSSSSEQLIRHRIVSKVLELGIVVHSVIIGISLGASQDVDTIRPLLAALSFHQFFEGLGLGGCISQAQFKSMSAAMMGGFFSLTTPVGIAIGIWISGSYDENSRTSLAVEGTLNAASAGILIYMALVDLLAADFMSPRLQSNLRIQLGANVSLLLGAACMSVLAKWA